MKSPLQNFGLYHSPKKQEEKYIIIKNMRDKRFPFLEICDYLNSSDYKLQRTDKFTSQQVFGLFDKMNKRIKRLLKIIPPKIYNFGIVNSFDEIINEKVSEIL